jgi:hypothetical protein
MAVEQITKNSTDGATMGLDTAELISFYGSTPVAQPASGNQAVAAITATNPTAPAAFTAPVTGAAITVSTAAATDLTTVGDALEVLRDEVATYETAISALVVDVTNLKTLADQLRSELVTLGLIKGAA